MQVADVYVDGNLRTHHTGGYLPFEVDLSPEAGKGKPVEVKVMLDNRDHPEFNPGRSQSQLDFTYAGGLYRNVWLEVTEPTYIEDVFATAIKVSAEMAEVMIQPSCPKKTYGDELEVSLLDPSGAQVGSGVLDAEGKTFIKVKKPHLWDLDHPNLYRAVTHLRREGQTIDVLETRFGIRHLEFDHKRGCFLNGRSIRLEGANRHMGFPIVGNAASDAAQYREARKLKSLGLNILRLAHYPQSPAFLDACDELGILVIDPIPGWQFYRDDVPFREHVLRDVRETVMRDRNHPCVAIFETCLNETYNATDDFWRECSMVAHQAFGQGNFFTGGDAYGKKDYSKPLWDVPWTGWDDDHFSRPALYKMQKGIDREYGDYEFGGEQSTSRVGRGDGEGALMLQAWNFIWSHNRNRGNPWSFGDLTWEGIDTYRGMNPTSPVSKSGMLDLFRLPKTVAFFYMSQGARRPMVHIANQWSARPSPTKVVVFSNCSSVALLLNGKEIARLGPDSGPTTGYLGPKVADPLYWAHGTGEILPATQLSTPIGGATGALPFSGGNCQNLAHPPFTFEGVPYGAGQIEAVGYLNGHAVARDKLYTPGKATHLALRVDTHGRDLEADGSDFVFVYAELRDDHDQVVPNGSQAIRLSVSGQGTLLGSGERRAEAGIAPFMIRASHVAGAIVLKATAAGIADGNTIFKSVPRAP